MKRKKKAVAKKRVVRKTTRKAAPKRKKTAKKAAPKRRKAVKRRAKKA